MLQVNKSGHFLMHMTFLSEKAANSGKPQPVNSETLEIMGTILSQVSLLRAMDNLDPDEDETMNRLKKSMNEEANAVLKDQDNFMMEAIMNMTRSFQPNATNRGETEVFKLKSLIG